MKPIAIILLIILCCTATQAQTIKGSPKAREIFQQKKTQKRYLRQQIVLLQTYLQFLKEGYKICERGLNLIGEIKDGNFKQHETYFNSLMGVKPAVRNSTDAASALEAHNKIHARLNQLQDQPYREEFEAADWNEVMQVASALKEKADASRNDLALVLEDGALKMRDDERLRRIAQINEQLQSYQHEAVRLVEAIHHIWASRAREREEINLWRSLNQPGT